MAHDLAGSVKVSVDFGTVQVTVSPITRRVRLKLYDAQGNLELDEPVHGELTVAVAGTLDGRVK